MSADVCQIDAFAGQSGSLKINKLPDFSWQVLEEHKVTSPIKRKFSSLHLAPALAPSTMTVTARSGTVNQPAHGTQTAHEIAPS
jgi:hypothetical protein